jgi:hypothetical protein
MGQVARGQRISFEGRDDDLVRLADSSRPANFYIPGAQLCVYNLAFADIAKVSMEN